MDRLHIICNGAGHRLLMTDNASNGYCADLAAPVVSPPSSRLRPQDTGGGVTRIVLCADDYGIAAGVSRAIRELLAAGRLLATNCMVVYPEFDEEGPRLAPFFGRADIGLHFTLTYERSVYAVMLDAYLGRLDAGAIRDAVDRQVARFTAVMSRAPDFIDGHQHVHHLPVIRDAIVEAARRIGAYVRITRAPLDRALLGRPAPFDSAMLSLMSRGLGRRTSDLVTNAEFRGTRTFRERVPFGVLFRRMIADAPERSLVVCHPGLVDDVLPTRDRITAPREGEFRYLMSDDFPRDLVAAGLALARMSDCR